MKQFNIWRFLKELFKIFFPTQRYLSGEDVISFCCWMMSWSICSGCQTAADLPSVFTFLSPSLLMQADSHSEHAPTSPLVPPTLLHLLLHSPPLTNLRCHLGILAMHSLQAAAGPQRRAWYTRCCRTKNPMQFKSERSLGVKIDPADTRSF